MQTQTEMLDVDNYLFEHILKFNDLDKFLEDAKEQVEEYYQAQNDFTDQGCFECYLKAYLMMYVSQFQDEDFNTLVENSVNCVSDDLKQKVLASTRDLTEQDFYYMLEYIEDTYDKLIYWGEPINRAEKRREKQGSFSIVKKVVLETKGKLVKAFS